MLKVLDSVAVKIRGKVLNESVITAVRKTTFRSFVISSVMMSGMRMRDRTVEDRIMRGVRVIGIMIWVEEKALQTCST